jgi:hypothetical protein
MERILIPQLSAKPGDVSYTFDGDARIGDGVGKWWQPWMQAHAAIGMDDACKLVGPAAGRALALRGALAVLRDGFTLRDGQWVSHDHLALDGRRGLAPLRWCCGTSPRTRRRARSCSKCGRRVAARGCRLGLR